MLGRYASSDLDGADQSIEHVAPGGVCYESWSLPTLSLGTRFWIHGDGGPIRPRYSAGYRQRDRLPIMGRKRDVLNLTSMGVSRHQKRHYAINAR